MTMLIKYSIDFLRFIYNSDPFPKKILLNVIFYSIVGLGFGILMSSWRGDSHAPMGCSFAGILWALRSRIV
ncbi:hypothetical protein BH09BAC3_BH09BAC3_37010 [soil metagenome]